MDPVVESALIGAAATAVGVGGTVVVAIVGFRSSRSATRDTIAAAHDTNQATIEAAHADVQHTLDTTRKGQITDLYSRAIEQLGSDKLDVRIGGIYALERVAQDSPADHPTVMEVLAALIRERSREQQPPADQADATHGQRPPAGKARVTFPRSPRPDIQAALTVIGRRNPQNDHQPIDLRGADLAGAILTRAYLANANLIGAEFTKAMLDAANLIGAKLAAADLTSAMLENANLTGADLNSANLSGAILVHADLTRALLMKADLSDTILWGVKLSGANLDGALWPLDEEVPESFEQDTDSGRLHLRGFGSEPPEDN